MSPGTAEEVLARMRPFFESAAAPYSHRPSALLALLHAVQDVYGHITPESEIAVSQFLGVGPNRVREAVTFYSLYRQRPAGKFHIKLCRTLSCHICGSADLVGALRRKLGVREGEATADGLFSFETVECLGCCDKAPAVQVNLGSYLGPMTAESLGALIDELRAQEEAAARERAAADES